MIHLAKSAVLKLWLLLLLLIVISAFLLGTGRLLTPLVSGYRSHVEQLLSEVLEQPLEIERLSAQWRGLGPELILEHVALLSPGAGDVTLRIRRIDIQVAVVDSLSSLSIKPRSITLSGLRLLIRRHPDGTVSIAGLKGLRKQEGEVSKLFGMPSRVRLEHSDIYWENQMTGAPPVHFPDISAQFRNDGEHHQLETSFDMPGGGSVHILGDIQGNPERAGDWAGELYVKASGLGLKRVLKQYVSSDYQIRDGALDLELWGRWEKNRFTRLDGDLALTRLWLDKQPTAPTDELASITIERLNGDLLWRRTADGWRLDASDIDITRAGARWPTSSLSLRARFDDLQRPALTAGMSFLRIEDLSAAALLLPLPETLQQALTQIQPRSDLKDLQINYRETAAGQRWAARGRISTLSSKPWKKVPGVENLDAGFWMNQAQGTLRLDSRNSRAWFPRLFRDPLQLEQVQGDLTWKRMSEGGWSIDSRYLLAITEDIRTQTRLNMHFPADPATSITLDLQTDFRDGKAAHAHRYYPVEIMPAAVVGWLDHGIIDGRVTRGSARVQGPLRDFPFDIRRSGQFQVLFDVEDVTLDYWPGWPRLEGVGGKIRFFNNRFDAWVQQGRIFDSRLSEAHGHIDDLKGGSPFELQGNVKGPFQDDLRLLRESPLASDFGGLTQGMRAGGQTRMQLDLAIPLKMGHPFRLDGTLFFDDASLILEDWNLPLQAIKGEMAFDQRSISAQGIRALALGSPISVDLATLPGEMKYTGVTASGRFSANQWAEHFIGTSPRWISGKSPWRLQLQIPHQQGGPRRPTRLDVTSDLSGTRIDLPAPLSKSLSGKRPLRISSEIGTPASGLVQVTYDDILNASLALEIDGSQTRLRSAGIYLGQGPARLPEQPGIRIDGMLDELDLDPWSSLLEAAPKDTPTLPLQRVQLSIDRLRSGDTLLRKLMLDLSRAGPGLAGNIQSKRLKGWLRIPDDATAPIKVRLEHLDLVFDSAQLATQEGEKADGDSTADPSRIPALDIEVEKVRINQQDFGSLQLISRQIPDGLELQTLSLNSERLQLSATGSWSRTAAGQHQTTINLSLSSDSLGRLLKDLAFDLEIEKAPTELAGYLSWNGSLLDFSAETLNGELSILIGKGILTNTKPGLGRILGLLNIGSLQRRLRLDFSDVVKEGFSFDILEGSFTLEDGDAYTNDLLIRGPAARIDFVGRIGLSDKDLDQLVGVTPNVSATLPLAGALAGGPVGAAAMLVAQGILGNQFNKIVRKQYQITGAWDDPEVVPLSDRNDEQDSQESTSITAIVEPINPDPAPQPKRVQRQKADQKQDTGFFKRLKKRLDAANEAPGLTPNRQ